MPNLDQSVHLFLIHAYFQYDREHQGVSAILTIYNTWEPQDNFLIQGNPHIHT